MAHIFQINISEGGVPKFPIAKATITLHGIEGDKQRDKKHHGGSERALCIYSLEHILDLQAEGNSVYPGATGENITIAGLNWLELSPGDQLRLGDGVTIEITMHTTPCHNIQSYFWDGKISRISQKTHPGWSRFYARVLEPGNIQIGDKVTLPKEMTYAKS